MSLNRTIAWAPSSALQNEFRRFFGSNGLAVAEQWAPRVDIREEANRFVILADVPGVDPAEIEVSMDKGVLSIKGERKSEQVEENGKFTRVERTRGAFQRSFALPDSADADSISASGKHGVLEIVIPKRAESAPRRIAITH